MTRLSERSNATQNTALRQQPISPAINRNETKGQDLNNFMRSANRRVCIRTLLTFPLKSILSLTFKATWTVRNLYVSPLWHKYFAIGYTKGITYLRNTDETENCGWVYASNINLLTTKAYHLKWWNAFLHKAELYTSIWKLREKFSILIRLSGNTVKRVRSEVYLAHAMRAYRWFRGIAPLILNHGTRCRWVSNFTFRPIYPRKKKTR
jgi:hypothetical protein